MPRRAPERNTDLPTLVQASTTMECIDTRKQIPSFDFLYHWKTRAVRGLYCQRQARAAAPGPRLFEIVGWDDVLTEPRRLKVGRSPRVDATHRSLP